MSVLKKYSRRPKFYYTLPSNNYFYEVSEEDLSILSEVGVMPLTIMNQMGLKNPEKLFNGSAIEDVIKDCTTIKTIEPRNLLKCDIDFLLVGIKIATSGDTETIHCKCPKCNNEMQYALNIEKLLSTVGSHKPSYHVDITTGLGEDRSNEDKVRIYMRPYSFGEYLELENESFNEQKAMVAIQQELAKLQEQEDAEFSEEDERAVLSKVNGILTNLTASVISIYSKAITKVVVLDKDGNETLESETDKDEIREFLTNGIGTDQHEKIKDVFAEINKVGINNIIDMECSNEECKHEFKYHYDINMTDFFATDS